MTRKQMKKLAKQLYEQELIHQDPDASKEAKAKAEDKIMQLTNYVMCLPDGFNTFCEIDIMIQDFMSKGEK